MSVGYGGGYSTTSYGAQGAADGGGFMGGSQLGGSQAAGKFGRDRLHPATIKQLIDADLPHTDANFKIDDVEIEQVSFVGQIRNISSQTTNITYKLDDGTGTIEVKQWVDADTQNNMEIDGAGIQLDPSKPKLLENEWARVWGKLKQFNNRRHVGAHVIRPITDKMDITYHFLEATYVHLYFSRGPLDQVKGEPASGVNGVNDYGGQGAGANGQNLPSMTPNARRVYEALRTSPQNNEGLHVQNVAATCHMNVADVMKAGEELLSNSLIFTTVDDNTWAILEF